MSRWQKKLIKEGKRILVWQTGSQNNVIQHDSQEDFSVYTRRNLSYNERFLREQCGEIEEANRIKEYLGKIIRTELIKELIPTGNYRVNGSLDRLDETINRFIEEDGLDLNPDYQRGHVWNSEQRILYVEFIMQGGKSNPIYFNHPGWMKSYNGNMEIVDGKQRLTSLLMFLNNEFPIFRSLDDEGVGFYRREFNMLGRDIEYIVNDLPSRKQVLEWYLQMNKGNVAHTSEEIDKVEKLLELED